MKIKTYEVVRADTPADFENECQAYLNDGYQPYGDPSFTVMDEEGSYIIWIQVFVEYGSDGE